ncbi:MAG: DUF3021 family protein [Lachnospiraceae bacterium]|nr:DUF3021 family protein [Lachnospiraceae bacterium]
MKQLLKIYLPSTCITFTLSLLGTSILNLINGFPYQSNGWILLLFGFIVVIDLIDYGLSFIDFYSYKTYFVVELIVTYLLMLIAGFWGNWFSFTASSIISVSVVFLIVYCCVHGYFYKRARVEAEEINSLINNS